MAEVTPFTYVNAINNGSNEPMSNKYNAFLVNRALSYHLDCIYIVNQINQYYSLDKDMQFAFLRAMIKPKKRFGKWSKPETNSDAQILSKHFGIPMLEAYQVLPLFNAEQLKQIDKAEKQKEKLENE